MEKAVCVYTVSRMASFQPIWPHHFWWYKNKTSYTCVWSHIHTTKCTAAQQQSRISCTLNWLYSFCAVKIHIQIFPSSDLPSLSMSWSFNVVSRWASWCSWRNICRSAVASGPRSLLPSDTADNASTVSRSLASKSCHKHHRTLCCLTDTPVQ